MKSRRRIGPLQPVHSLPYRHAGGVLCITAKKQPMCEVGHLLHFGFVSMPGLPTTTTEWRRFENGQNVPRGDFTHEVDPLQGSRSAIALADLACGAIPLPR